MPADKLTLNQERFVAEFLIDLNATQAAIRAGYSTRTAEQQGWRLLRNAKVSTAISIAQAKRSERTGVTADRVVTEYAKLAFANMGDYMRVGPDGDPQLHFGDLTRDQQAALQEVTVDSYVEGSNGDARAVKRVKFKLGDKLHALDSVAKHLGMFTERHEVTGKDGAPLVPADPSKIALVLLNILSRGRPEPEDL